MLPELAVVDLLQMAGIDLLSLQDARGGIIRDGFRPPSDASAAVMRGTVGQPCALLQEETSMKHALIVATVTVLAFIAPAVPPHSQSVDSAPGSLGEGLSRSCVTFNRAWPEMFVGACRVL